MTSEQQDRLDAILESAVDAIIIINEAGLIEVANPATTSMFGYSASELIGQNVKMLIPSPYQEEHDGFLRRYRTTGYKRIIGVGREVLGLKQDGSVFPVHVAVSEFHSGGRRLFAGIVRDVSDLKAAQSELERANRLLEQRIQEKTQELERAQAELLKNERLATLGQVSGGIAHEVRNPLNAVKTSVYYLLNARSPTPEKTREHLERIDRQVNLIDHVLTALTDVAPMPEPRLEWLDARELIADAVAQVEFPANIQVDNRVSNRPVRIRSDRYQLPIVLRNLLRNARDAMPEGGQIVVGARAEAGVCVIFVQDNGAGIAAENLPRITEPFFSTKARGMGLGLAISKSIIEKNGGRLDIESDLGKGSTFSLVFPGQKDG